MNRTGTCERTAQLVSLDLDGQLSYFERALLARHLARCAVCSEEARRTTAVTRLLRSAPLEPIELPALPGRPRRARRTAGALALAAVLSVASVAAWFGLAPSSGPGSSTLSISAHGVSAHGSGVHARPNDHFDWAAGPPRATQIVQFVPGGRFTFSS
jgi:anti-sigma factor RsiW